MLAVMMVLLQQDICTQVLSVYNYHTPAGFLGTSDWVSRCPGFDRKTDFDFPPFTIKAALP
jgi:hypothetical protein